MIQNGRSFLHVGRGAKLVLFQLQYTLVAVMYFLHVGRAARLVLFQLQYAPVDVMYDSQVYFFLNCSSVIKCRGV